MTNKYYIYLHLDPITDEVKYVGKGHGRRAYSFSHRKGYHKNWIAKLAKSNLKPKVEIFQDLLSEIEALDQEKYWIEYFRSVGDKLTNLTDGGEGVSGYKFPDELKKKLNALKTWPKEATAKAAELARGKPRSEEVKKKISESHKGLKLSDYHKQQLRLAKARPIKCIETGEVYSSVREASEKLNIPMYSINGMLRGEIKKTHGLRFELCQSC